MADKVEVTWPDQRVEEDLEPICLCIFTTLWCSVLCPRYKSGSGCPAAHLIDGSLCWKWPIHETSNPLEKTEAQNSEFLLSTILGAELELEKLESLFPFGDPESLLTKPALQRSPWVWPFVQGKEPLCSTIQTTEPTLSPQAPGISFNLHFFSSWWPYTGWHLWVDTDKRKWKPGPNHRSESLTWSLSQMCGKYNCCFPFPPGLWIQGSSFGMGRDIYNELSFFPWLCFFPPDYNLYLKTFPTV